MVTSTNSWQLPSLNALASSALSLLIALKPKANKLGLGELLVEFGCHACSLARGFVEWRSLNPTIMRCYQFAPSFNFREAAQAAEITEPALTGRYMRNFFTQDDLAKGWGGGG